MHLYTWNAANLKCNIICKMNLKHRRLHTVSISKNCPKNLDWTKVQNDTYTTTHFTAIPDVDLGQLLFRIGTNNVQTVVNM